MCENVNCCLSISGTISKMENLKGNFDCNNKMELYFVQITPGLDSKLILYKNNYQYNTRIFGDYVRFEFYSEMDCFSSWKYTKSPYKTNENCRAWANDPAWSTPDSKIEFSLVAWTPGLNAVIIN